ncbi:MAG: glycoside hydrolase family 28 protein [Ignavibacteriales bacterium]|nr:glycoside hydrolase family 28 protein [Ignavibacteriales bacterium]
MHKRVRTGFVLAAMSALLSCPVAAQWSATLEQEIKSYTANLPFAMPQIQLPQIPAQQMSIVDFGAVADGHTMNTTAINNAIQACAKKGGGTVVIPPGTWLTGPIGLQSNIELRIETGALVIFSPKFEDYAVPTKGNRVTSPIHGQELTNVAITGTGTFNGNGHYWRPVKKEKLTAKQWKDLVASGGVVTPDGKMWWPSKEAMNGEEFLKNLRRENKKPTPEEIAGAREFLRPTMLDLVGCSRVLIDGPTFTNTPGWALHPSDCDNVIICNTTVINNWWGQNTDAADIGACRNVLFFKNVLDAGDDGICMKSNVVKNREFALENIVIADCIVYHGHGGFVIGSNTDGGIRNISVRNCTFIGTDIGLRFKSARDRGGKVENIFVDGIRMKDIATSAILFDMFYEGNADFDPAKAKIPYFRNFDIRNIVCDGAKNALFVRGLAEAPIQSVTLKNIAITSDEAMSMEDADGFTLLDVWLNFKSGPVLSVKNTKNVQLEKITTASQAALFLRAQGASTERIRVQRGDIARAKKDIELGQDVKQGAIVIQ